MGCMFEYCSSLAYINLSNFKTQTVTNIFYMFNNCSSLTNINLSNFNTQNITDMRCMFYNSSSLKMKNAIVKDKNIIKKSK